MQDLARQSCEPCSGESPAVPEAQWPALLNALPEWQIAREDGTPVLTKTYRFKNFVRALAFARKVGDLAEAENHHPRLLVEYGRVEVAWWTHAIGGLHRNDFIMAARTDEIPS
jgi:4a-hydroxytetrahydrobiopterin dehydratase